MIKKVITLFFVGAALYSAIEILWRGFTHWTMAIAGGISLCGIDLIDECFRRNKNFLKYAMCSVMISLIELSIGLIVNIWLKMNVWDYSTKKFNLFGQICPIYTFYWFLLSIPAVHLCKFIKSILFENVEK